MDKGAQTRDAVAAFSPRKLRPFLELARLRGHDVDALLQAHGTSFVAIHDPDLRLPRITCIHIVAELICRLDDPCIGLHAADHFELADLDLIGLLAEQHTSVLQALEAVVGYASLIGDASRAALVRERGCVILEQWVLGKPAQLPELADYQIASSHRAVCLLSGTTIAPLRVELARPQPRDASHYHRYFGARVRFEAARGRLVYPEAPLCQPRNPGNVRLAQLLSEQIQTRVSRLRPTLDLIERARLTLLAQLEEGNPSLGSVAKELRMSERTLRRRLEELRHSYRGLLDAVRRERALQLIAAGKLNVGQLAQRLGFDDPTAFARAFRRWTGHSPSAYQKSVAPQAPIGTAYKPPSSVG